MPPLTPNSFFFPPHELYAVIVAPTAQSPEDCERRSLCGQTNEEVFILLNDSLKQLFKMAGSLQTRSEGKNIQFRARGAAPRPTDPLTHPPALLGVFVIVFVKLDLFVGHRKGL